MDEVQVVRIDLDTKKAGDEPALRITRYLRTRSLIN